MFGSFGKILLLSEILSNGNSYVFTFSSGEWFFFHSPETIKVDLAERMTNLGQVVSVTRSLFSDRYVVTVISTSNETLSSWLSVFDVSWRDIGWDTIIFDMAEEGIVSSQAGGISTIIPDIGRTVGATVTEVVKPLLPYILIGIIIYAVIPSMIAKRREA